MPSMFINFDSPSSIKLIQMERIQNYLISLYGQHHIEQITEVSQLFHEE